MWLVIADGRHARHEELFQPMRVQSQIAAEELARHFVIATGTVFVLEQDSQTWTTVTSGR